MEEISCEQIKVDDMRLKELWFVEFEERSREQTKVDERREGHNL